MPEPGVGPTQQRLERDLQSADFDSGVRAGLWQQAVLRWPFLTIAVAAGDGRQLGLRITVDDYPARAPGGRLWDLDRDVPLPPARWPVGGSTAQVFRPDWPNSTSPAPYMACDREGLAAHPNWADEHPGRAWNPRRTITFYLGQIHHELRAATLPQDQAGSAG